MVTITNSKPTKSGTLPNIQDNKQLIIKRLDVEIE